MPLFGLVDATVLAMILYLATGGRDRAVVLALYLVALVYSVALFP